MDKLPDNRCLTIPLHHFGISSPSRRMCLTVAVVCVMKYNRQSPAALMYNRHPAANRIYVLLKVF